jgi:hypothetical protein
MDQNLWKKLSAVWFTPVILATWKAEIGRRILV